MTAARSAHSATLLLDGRVLLAGGNNHGNLTNSAELYDPSTGSFASIGSMTSTRYYHTATLLPDGRVLIAGGTGGPRATGLVSAELYVPDTGTFTATGSMAAGHTPAMLLTSGKVLMTGGASFAELYDPAAGIFTAAGAYASASAVDSSTATVLADGRVFVTGCALDDAGLCAFAAGVTQLYDPATDTFTLGATTYDCAHSGTASLLPNGKVVFAGGGRGGQVWMPCDAALYDPSTDNFTRTGTSGGDRNPATLLPDGRVLIVGANATVTPPPRSTIRTAERLAPSATTRNQAGTTRKLCLKTAGS